MTKLLDLPNELLIPILESLPAPELLRLAFTCRRFNILTKKRRLFHIYGFIHFEGRGPSGVFPVAIGSPIDPIGFRRSPLQFLDLVRVCPHIAQYAVCLEYRWNQYCYCPPRVAGTSHHACDQGINTLVEERAVCSLLANLPNLEEITFYGGNRPGPMARVLRHALIAEMPTNTGQLPTLNTEIPKLTKVSTFRYQSEVVFSEHPHSDDLLVMVYAALLPSMKKLFGRSLIFQKLTPESVTDAILGPWLFGIRKSTVKEIKLDDIGRSDPSTYPPFLSGFRGLRSFKLESGNLRGITGFKRALLDAGKASLQVLDLHTQDMLEWLYLGTLKDFEQLRSISVDYAMFVDNEGIVHPLVEMLPASVKRLLLRDMCRGDVMELNAAECLFQQLPKLKSMRFPELRSVSSTSPLPTKIKWDCMVAGISTPYDRRLHFLRVYEWGSEWPFVKLPHEEYDNEDLRQAAHLPGAPEYAATLDRLFKNYNHLGFYRSSNR
ncbi:hypothetical protein MMC30_008488 [Trapelia coarctata]|nr:hypothetical protein [Trapelia coarctata]